MTLVSKKPIRLLRAGLSILGFGFFAYSLVKVNWAAWTASLPTLGLSVPFFLLSVFMTVNGYVRLTDVSPSNKALVRKLENSFIESWIARYIPGPSAISYKAIALKELSFSARSIRKILTSDLALTMVTTAIFAIPMLLYGLASGEVDAGQIALHVPVDVTLIVIAALLVGIVFWMRCGLCAILYFASRTALGVGFLISFMAVEQMEIGTSIAFLGIYFTSVIVGYAALFVPGGIGVREGSFILLVVFLGHSAEVATILAASARVSSLVSDLILFMWFQAIKRKRLGGIAH